MEPLTELQSKGMLQAFLAPTLTELHTKGRLPAFLPSTRLDCKWLSVTNTLAYYDTE